MTNKDYLCIKANTIIVSMNDQLSEIKRLIEGKDTDSAVERLNTLIKDPDCCFEKDKVYYILGNVYRKKGDFKMALNNYLQAISINPDSPASNARNMIMDILNFYNKDMYNQ